MPVAAAFPRRKSGEAISAAGKGAKVLLDPELRRRLTARDASHGSYPQHPKVLSSAEL